MTRIATVAPEHARGFRRALLWTIKRQYGGFIPGVFRVLLADLRIGMAAGKLYKHLHMRKRSPLTRLQREMLATVVNGIIGGAP